MDVQRAAKKLLERCFWHRVSVFFYEVRMVVKIYQDKMEKQKLQYNSPTFALLKNMFDTLQNWDTLIFRNHNQVVDIDVLSRFLQAVEFNLKKLITLLETSIQILRSDVYPEYMRYIKMTVDMGLALSNHIDYEIYLKQWAIENPELFWPSILQPIHTQFFFLFHPSVKGEYRGKPPKSDMFSERFDVMEISAMQMTSSELEKLKYLFREVANTNTTFFFKFIEKMTSVQYHRFKHPAQSHFFRECFAYSKDGHKILKFLECFPIMPFFEFDALSHETQRRIIQGTIQYHFYEPFKIFKTINEQWAICLPSDFETVFETR